MKKLRITQSVNWHKVMRISLIQFILLFLIIGFSYAHTTIAQAILNKEVTVNVENVSLKEAIKNIEKQTQIPFVYSNRINLKGKVSLNAERTKLSSVLDRLLLPSKITYRVINEQIVLTSEKEQNSTKGESPSHSMIELMPPSVPVIVITGRVVDDKGEPLIGASVVLEGTTKGTLTDVDGTYKLELEDSETKGNLVISFVGYENKTIAINGHVSATYMA